MSAKGGEPADEDKPPQKSRSVPVRTVGGGVKMVSLPEDVAGQWDDEQWHDSPPGV